MTDAQVTDFESVLNVIDRMIEAGEDPWFIITEAAHGEEANIDAKRWHQCDLAARVESRYGSNALADFAKDANLPVRRAAEYKTMGTFYKTRSARAEFLADNPVITYSHLRTIARRASDETQAYALAHKASLRSWTVEKTDYMLWRWAGLLGKVDRLKPKTPKPLMDFILAGKFLGAFAPQNVTVTDDKQYRIVVYEVTP